MAIESPQAPRLWGRGLAMNSPVAVGKVPATTCPTDIRPKKINR